MAAGERVKLRIKIGVHELETEGPRDFVTSQLDAWTRLAGLPASSDGRTGGDDPALRGLFTVDADRQLIALNARTSGRRRNADAAVLLLHAHQALLGNGGAPHTPAARLHAALIASGHRLRRPDRVLTRYIAAGLVYKSGRHKHETYALTPRGVQHALALARYLNGRR